MANRWETMEIVTDFIFGDSKVTTDGDCSHEIKRCLLLGRKAMTKLDSIFIYLFIYLFFFFHLSLSFGGQPPHNIVVVPVTH